jgi:RNA polymerase sigma-70 factor, ECF subfamily
LNYPANTIAFWPSLSYAHDFAAVPHGRKIFCCRIRLVFEENYATNGFAMESPEGITQLLVDWGNGDQAALDKLMPLVYAELRRLATNYLRRERMGHTLQPTALVNEAYLKLVGQKNAKWQNRAQFFAISAQLMRRILVDHARRHQAEKRGGSEQQRLSITSAEELLAQPAIDLLALNEALEELSQMDPQQGRIVELKFFGGLSIDETAEVLGIGHATVEREWKSARAWLRRQLEA